MFGPPVDLSFKNISALTGRGRHNFRSGTSRTTTGWKTDCCASLRSTGWRCDNKGPFRSILFYSNRVAANLNKPVWTLPVSLDTL